MVSDDSREFHKPVRRPAELFDRRFAAEDPAEVSRVAHSTAHALLARAREDPDGEVVDRLVAFTEEHGIDDIAELWSRSPSRSLPGTLWRLYLIQLMIHDDPHTAALLYERGRVEIASADPVVAGAPTPAGPDELVDLVDTILRGLFQGDCSGQRVESPQRGARRDVAGIVREPQRANGERRGLGYTGTAGPQ